MSAVPALYGRTVELLERSRGELERAEGLDARWPQAWPIVFAFAMEADLAFPELLVETVVTICRSPREIDRVLAWHTELRTRREHKRVQRATRPRPEPAPPPGRWDLEDGR